MSLFRRLFGKTELRTQQTNDLNETTALFVFDYSQMDSSYGKQAFDAIYSVLRNSKGMCAFHDGDLRSPETVRELAKQARIVKPSHPNSPLHNLETPYAFGAYVIPMWSNVAANLGTLHQALAERHLAGYQGFMVFPGKDQPQEFIYFAFSQLHLPQAIVLQDGKVTTSKYGVGR
jgi:hypothetical protein